MAQIIREITIDVARDNNFQAIVAKQNDTNSRFLKVTIANDGEPISIPQTAIVTINALREDSEARAFAGTVETDGTVLLPLTYWMLELDGTVKCDVSVFDSTEGAEVNRLTTTMFSLQVEQTAYTGTDISEDENYDILVELISEVSGIKVDEDARVVAEQGRVSAENARVSAEQGRTSTEQERVTHETARVNAETGRQNAEAARVTAENGRATATATAISNAQTATSNANTATGNANTAANRANAAAERIEEDLQAVNVSYDNSESGLDSTNVQDVLDEVVDKFGNVIKVETFEDVQKIVRQGLAPKRFNIAEQFETLRGSTTLTFDIVDFDKCVPVDESKQHCLNLLLHNVFTYGSMPFSASQLLYYTRDGLAAGTYKFTLNHARYGNGTEYDGTYMFTLTTAIPAGGGFRHSNIGGYKTAYAKSDVIGNYLVSYQPVSSGGASIQTVAVREYDGTSAIELGTFTAQNRTYYTEDDAVNVGGKRNFTERNFYGSNRWKNSVYRQYLNSVAEAVPSGDSTISNWWTPQTVWDRIPGAAKWAGFLNGLDSEFIAVLGTVQVKTPLHACDRVDGETFDITEDKIFLASRENVFGSREYSTIDEGGLWEYFKGASNDDRIKYEGNTARYWWLRTPFSGTCGYVRTVMTTGTLNGYYANSRFGVVPACCII